MKRLWEGKHRMELRHSILINLAIICLLSSVPTLTQAAAFQQDRAENSPARRDDSLPLHARYAILFRRLAGSQPENRDAGSPGGTNEARYAALLQREVPLSDEQMHSLLEIAAECQRQVAETDARARTVIKAFRAQNPNAGPSAPGEGPFPPPELPKLQQERNSIVMQAREKLRSAFGEEVFRRFDSYITSHGNGRTFTLPPAGRPPVTLQAAITILADDGQTEKRQFRVGEKVVIRIALLNNSSQPISVRQADLYDWFELSRGEGSGGVPIFVHPPEQEGAGGAQAGQKQDVELPTGQEKVVGELDLGEARKFLRPGRYVVTAHPRVLLNRPPDHSEFVELTSADGPATFEILP